MLLCFFSFLWFLVDAQNALAQLLSSDWASKWGNDDTQSNVRTGTSNVPTRVLEKAFQVDPFDSRVMMRGSGTIELGNGLCIMKASPRLYIAQVDGDDDGFGNVEFVAYGKYQSFGSLKSSSGLTMAARTSHSRYKVDGCDAAGYYARIYAQTGEASFQVRRSSSYCDMACFSDRRELFGSHLFISCCFCSSLLQKEYYHGSDGTVYSNSRRVNLFEGGIPLDQFVGLKFRIFTTGENNDEVKLELYVDRTNGENGGDWVLVHSFIDKQGAMPAGKKVPSHCTIQSGDPILLPGHDCFLRSDGDDGTVVHWKNSTIREIKGF